MLKSFILNNYNRINILKDTANGTVEQVLGPDGKVYIRKTLPGVFLPCKELMSINNPYIVKTVQAASDEDGSYAIEEYAEGKSLEEYLDDGKSFSEKEVVGIALQLCEALTCLHEHKLVHRDIKPSNILLHSSGAVKLIDFGACRSFSDNEEKVRDTVVIGTTCYAAPEQFGGKPTDHRADIYSLAITMKDLLGEKYQGKLSSIIAKCLEFDPNHRPQNAEELKKLLLSVQNNALKWMKYMTASAAVLALAAGGFWYFRQQAAVLPENNIAVTAAPVKKSSAEETKKTEPNEKVTGKADEKVKASESLTSKTSEKVRPVEKRQDKVESKNINQDIQSSEIQLPKVTIKSSFVVSKEEVEKAIKRDPIQKPEPKLTAASDAPPSSDKKLEPKMTVDSAKQQVLGSKKPVSTKKSVKINIDPKNWFYTYAVTDHSGNRLKDSQELRIADYSHQPEIVLSTGKKALMNMRATYEFHDIKFWGDDITVGPNSVGNIYRWQVFKDDKGNASKVVHSISGEIIDEVAPYFSLHLVNVGLWFLTGNNPSLTITVEADNADAVTMTIPVIIK